MKRTSLREHYADFRSNWETLTLYQRFEHAIALLLTWLIAVIVVATWGARPEVLALIAQRAIDPLGHRVFQAVFGEVMTLRIALEFRHSIIRVAAQQESIVQVKTVLLICVTRDRAQVHHSRYGARHRRKSLRSLRSSWRSARAIG